MRFPGDGRNRRGDCDGAFRYIETAIIVVYTHTRKEYFPFIHGAYRSLRVPSPLMSGILRRGTPLLVNEFLWSSGMAVLLQCYSVRA